MKTTSGALRAHLDETVTTLATCWDITRRDGTVFRYTDHDRDLLVSGNTYSSTNGYSRSAVSTDDTLSVDNLETTGYLAPGQVTAVDVRAGLWDHAEVRMFLVNWADTTQGILRLRRGRLGEVSTTQTGLFRSELRGLTQSLQQRILELYGPECRADLGDSRCRVPIDPPVRINSTAYAVGDHVKVVTAAVPDGTYGDYENRIYRCTTAGTSDASAPTFDETPGNTTNDGTVVWTAVQAWTRHAEVATAANRLTFTITVDEARAVDDWFNYGAVIFESGPNAGAVREVKNWVQSTSTVELFSPVPFNIGVGDKLRLYKGCDKTRETCAFFENILNFRGEPFMTGNDFVFSTASGGI